MPEPKRSRSYMRTYTYTFMDDSLCALDALLSLVHYDDLASSFYDLLPLDLRTDLENKKWLEYQDGQE